MRSISAVYGVHTYIGSDGEVHASDPYFIAHTGPTDQNYDPAISPDMLRDVVRRTASDPLCGSERQ